MMTFGIVVWLAAVPPVLQLAVPVSVAGVGPETLARPRSRRFTPVEDSAVHILRVSAGAFWISSDTAPSDGFLLLQGPAIATERLATLTAATGPPELPLFVSAGMPSSIRGRAERRP